MDIRNGEKYADEKMDSKWHSDMIPVLVSPNIGRDDVLSADEYIRVQMMLNATSSSLIELIDDVDGELLDKVDAIKEFVSIAMELLEKKGCGTRDLVSYFIMDKNQKKSII